MMPTLDGSEALIILQQELPVDVILTDKVSKITDTK